MHALANKQIVVGITGGIAAYKSADLVRRLREEGALVRVVMTASAKQFITALTMQAVSGNPVHDDLFDLNAEAAMGHIELARWADLLLVAPASADFMARLAHGQANDLLTTLCLATHAPIMIAPAMNQAMWLNSLTQANQKTLLEHGIQILGPTAGLQACGDVGPGRLIEPVEITQHVCHFFSAKSASQTLAGKHVVLTAGPTQEALDPVRYLSNYSSGKMGYALAEAARDAGATVTLITGPTTLVKPSRIKCIDVITAQEMHDAVLQEVIAAHIFIAVAAVADYRAAMVAPHKISKAQDKLTIHLERNPDIVASVAKLAKKPYTVGFAAETENLIAHAQGKLFNKNLDMIIANQVGDGTTGFGSDENAVIVLWGKQQQQTFPQAAKKHLARELIALIAEAHT